MNRNSRPRNSGISHRSSIPKLNYNPGSMVKRKSSSEDICGPRRSVDKIGPVSLAGAKMTPKTSVNNHRFGLPSSAVSNRQSVDTVRSSISGKSKKIAWPVTDINFKTHCKDNISEFLAFHHYVQPLSAQDWVQTGPTAREFANIFTFIFTKLNPNYKRSQHIEEDIPKLLKSLDYPFQMPRSSFLNVASPHTWPHILAMLSWLVDQCKLMSAIDIKQILFSTDFEESFDTNLTELKFDALLELHRADENEEKRQEIIQNYEYALQSISKVLPEDFYHLQGEEEEIREELKNLPMKIDEVEQLSIKLDHLNEDHEKLSKFNEDLNGHAMMKKNENLMLEKEVDSYKLIFEERLQRIEDLKETKKKQNLSSSEVNEFRNEARHLSSVIGQLDKEEENINNQINQTEMSISKIDQVLRNEAYNINLKVRNLQMGCEELVIYPIEEQETHWVEYFFPFFKAQKKSQHNDTLQEEKKLAMLTDENVRVENKFHSLEKEFQKQTAKMSLLEKEISNIEQEHSMEEKELQRECESYNLNIEASLKELLSMQSTQKELKDKLVEANQMLKNLNKEDTSMREQATERILKLQEVANSYCVKRQKFVDGINKKMDKEIEERRKFIKDVKEKIQ